MIDEALFGTARLWVVGNVNRDLKTTPLAEGPYLFRDGETSVAGIHETIGGGGANSAAMAASLGAQSTLLGLIGEDALGQRLEQLLQGYGVACRLHHDPTRITGTTLNLVYENGQRHFLSCHPNNAALAFERLDLRGLETATHLLRADIWFSEAMLYGGNRQLLEAARAAGVTTSIDLNWDPQWGRADTVEIQRRKEAVRAILPLVDLAHGNIRELNEFTGESELPASLQRLLDWGVAAVVVHMGAQGAGWFSRGELLIEPAAPIERRAIATGTGDLLSVCVMLLHHRPEVHVVDQLRLANRIVAEFIEGRRELIPRF